MCVCCTSIFAVNYAISCVILHYIYCVCFSGNSFLSEDQLERRRLQRNRVNVKVSKIWKRYPIWAVSPERSPTRSPSPEPPKRIHRRTSAEGFVLVWLLINCRLRTHTCLYTLTYTCIHTMSYMQHTHTHIHSHVCIHTDK